MSQAHSDSRMPRALIEDGVRRALQEDLGLLGDITTNATVDSGVNVEAVIAARQAGVVAGLSVAAETFRQVDANIQFAIQTDDSAQVSAGSFVAKISGPARGILTGERVALNFMGRMSGIATLTSEFVGRVAGTNAKIVDTRKTTPGLRAFEKYAVHCGGGQNHRSGLFDAILIKDNHIVAAGGIAAAIERARTSAGHMVKIEVEVDTLEQLDAALEIGVDAVLLDNMSAATLKKAVKRVDGRCLTEASGGVTLDSVRDIALAGVDMISVGALTHSAVTLDLGLDFGSFVRT